MRNLFWAVGLFVVLAMMPSAQAADANGTWKGSFDFQGTNVPVTLHLAVAGSTVTGTVEGLPNSPAEIHDGKVDGDTVSFWVNSDYEGQTYKLVYKGKVSAGQIEFSFGTEDGSWGTTMTAKSEMPAVKPSAPDATGTWKGAFDFQGTNVQLTFHLTAAGGTLTGTVEGLPASPLEIHEGKVDGNTVTFTVTTDYQGSPVRLVYKGTVTAEGIKFSFGTEDGSWGTELTTTKSI